LSTDDLAGLAIGPFAVGASFGLGLCVLGGIVFGALRLVGFLFSGRNG